MPLNPNAQVPIVVMVSGMLRVLIALMAKACSGIVSTPLPSDSEVIAAFQNASAPILATVSGMTRCPKLLPENALAPIVVTLPGKVTSPNA